MLILWYEKVWCGSLCVCWHSLLAHWGDTLNLLCWEYWLQWIIATPCTELVLSIPELPHSWSHPLEEMAVTTSLWSLSDWDRTPKPSSKAWFGRTLKGCSRCRTQLPTQVNKVQLQQHRRSALPCTQSCCPPFTTAVSLKSVQQKNSTQNIRPHSLSWEAKVENKSSIYSAFYKAKF